MFLPGKSHLLVSYIQSKALRLLERIELLVDYMAEVET